MDWEKRGKKPEASAKFRDDMESCAEAAVGKGGIGQKRRKRGQESAIEEYGRQCERDGKASRRRHRRILYISILISMILLHIAAWSSRGFCDWYLEHVFGIWVDTYGRLVGLVPFSVGEVLIGFAAGFAAVGAVLGAIWLVDRAAVAWGKRGKKRYGAPGEVRENRLRRARGLGEVQGNGRERRSWLGRACRAYCAAGLWMLLGAFVLMTLNCYILYHGSGFSGTYLTGEEREYTFEDLTALRNFVVEQCNGLCCQVPRKEDGSLFYEGDMLETAKAAMRQLGETYEGLGGFYPTPKPLLSSDFMSQQHIAGCFYPFSMEANYNDVMYVMNLPSTLCHELGHLKGYIREDEANLIGYLACVRSEDVFFQYSGYLSVLYYVDNDFRQTVESSGGLAPMSVPEQPGESLSGEAWGQPEDFARIEILPQVHADNIFLTSQERTRIERDTLLDTEAVDAISDSIADASLKLNGVRDGMISYSRVVELLLRYYDIYGYP